jgi:hypothetical protein
VEARRRVVEVDVAERERLAAPDRGRVALEFVEGDVDPRVEQLPERAVDAFPPQEGRRVPELAPGRAKELEIGASRMGEDGALDEAEQRRLARLQAPADDRLGRRDRDRLAEEGPQPERESEDTEPERGVGPDRLWQPRLRGARVGSPRGPEPRGPERRVGYSTPVPRRVARGSSRTPVSRIAAARGVPDADLAEHGGPGPAGPGTSPAAAVPVATPVVALGDRRSA